MKRRDLLALGATGAALGATGCGPSPGALEAMAPEVPPETFLAMLDRQLPAVDRARFVDGLVGRALAGRALSPAAQQTVDDNDATMRRMLRTLLITQGFRELPKSTQVAPPVQERMLGHMEEVDASIFEVTSRLAAMSPDDRRGLRDTLRARPELPMEIAAAIDGHAAAAGITAGRRAQLRSMMANAAFRLKHGDPSAMIDEYVAKVERFRGQTATDAKALALAETYGQRAFWQYQRHLQTAPGATAPVAPANPAAPGERPGQWSMRAGGYMMGTGVVVFGVSLLLVDTAGGFVFGVTVGAVLFAVGLIFLVVGALRYALSS